MVAQGLAALRTGSTKGSQMRQAVSMCCAAWARCWLQASSSAASLPRPRLASAALSLAIFLGQQMQVVGQCVVIEVTDFVGQLTGCAWVAGDGVGVFHGGDEPKG